jgi:hypothetical protein
MLCAPGKIVVSMRKLRGLAAVDGGGNRKPEDLPGKLPAGMSAGAEKKRQKTKPCPNNLRGVRGRVEEAEESEILQQGLCPGGQRGQPGIAETRRI